MTTSYYQGIPKGKQLEIIILTTITTASTRVHRVGGVEITIWKSKNFSNIYLYKYLETQREWQEVDIY
jgi:hypothetical protein